MRDWKASLVNCSCVVERRPRPTTFQGCVERMLLEGICCLHDNDPRYMTFTKPSWRTLSEEPPHA